MSTPLNLKKKNYRYTVIFLVYLYFIITEKTLLHYLETMTNLSIHVTTKKYLVSLSFSLSFSLFNCGLFFLPLFKNMFLVIQYYFNLQCSVLF
ncbi:hypothetical protein BD770DRAFT_400928 [Pilaira anomala]|nr:hypothetical protein BD770DRAFT_400928 [Pilaira anomala]